MKFTKLFLIGLAPIFLLSACRTKQKTSSTTTPTSTSTSSEDDSNNSKLANAFKNMGEEIAYVAASKPITKSMVDMSEDDKKMQLGSPCGIIYVVGKLYENEAFDCSNKVVEFREVYDVVNGSSPVMVEDITLSLMIDVDTANNKAKLYAREIIDATESMHMKIDAYMFLEFDYNFVTNDLGDFKAWYTADSYMGGSETPSSTGLNYAVRQGEDLKKLDTNTKDEEYNTVVNQIETFVTFFNSKAETKTVADATTARKYGESFIAGLNYINEITNLSGSFDFHNK